MEFEFERELTDYETASSSEGEVIVDEDFVSSEEEENGTKLVRDSQDSDYDPRRPGDLYKDILEQPKVVNQRKQTNDYLNGNEIIF